MGVRILELCERLRPLLLVASVGVLLGRWLLPEGWLAAEVIEATLASWAAWLGLVAIGWQLEIVEGGS